MRNRDWSGNTGEVGRMVMARKNPRRFRRISTEIADKIADFGHIHTARVVSANDSNARARQLVNRWEGINTNNIDRYASEVRELHRLTCNISTNIEHVKNMFGVMPFLSGKYSKINGIIDCYNDYVRHNQFMQLKYGELNHIDLSGVDLIYSDTPITDTDYVIPEISNDWIRCNNCNPRITTHKLEDILQ